MTRSRTRGEAHHQQAHRSLWRRALARRAGEQPLDDWLVEQANLRGFHGAFLARPVGVEVDDGLSLEDIVVGLCQPHAPADARTLKLALRILQSGQVDPDHLAWLARKERADFVLYWFLQIVPNEERNDAVDQVASRFASPPRGQRRASYRYDPARLLRRRAALPSSPA